MTPQQVDALLAACERSTPVGRRDLAILTVLARLGLRAGEVAGLRLDDIDWRRGEITVSGKGNRHERLPLPVDVGEAVVAYLTESRPATAEVRAVFVTSQFRGTTTYTIGGAEGFQGYVITEHEDLAVVGRAALGIAEYGRAFVAYLEWMGASQEAVEQFKDYYQGSWPNLAAWAEATVNGFGWWQAIEQAVPANLLPYVEIDYRRLGQDMARGMHIVQDDDRHEVHLFRLAL